MDSSRALQPDGSGPIAGPSTSFLVPIIPQARSITTNHGDVNFAGRDVNVHNHYHSYPDKVDIGAVLSAVRNLRIIHSDNLSKATPGTGVWFLRTNMFRMWLDPNGNLKILWGTGIPGAGKTVLTSIAIRDLEARARVPGSRICVCYVYIRYSDSTNLTVRSVLEIIVKQTVERHPECASIAEQAYAQHVREKTQPTEEELLWLCHQFTAAIAVTFYFLDALDEAPDRIQVDLVQKLASLNARLFITSRPLEAVQARLSGTHCFPIVAKDGDLDLHIAQGIARSRDLATLLEKAGSTLREEIVSLIKSKCGGMFLHASLQLDTLGECINARDVRQTLEAFPSRIEKVYLQTWKRILGQKGNQVSTAKALLVWILNAVRPMTIEALERAVAISPDTYTFEPDRLVPGATLIALCHGLVALEEKSRIVRLVHYTAKDTLQRLLCDSFPHPHSHLATVSMRHLAECGFQNTMIRSREEFISARRADPLLEYASDNWATHARQCLDAEEAKRRIASFVRESHAYPAFTDSELFWDFDILGPSHILALHNLPMSLITLDDIGDPNAMTQIHGIYPLTLASRNGNEAAAESLIAHLRIQVNVVDDEGSSALMMACRKGHTGIVKLLLSHSETLVNLVDDERSSALMLAAVGGHEGVVELLLERPEIQVNLLNKRSKSSALVMAAGEGHKGIVKLLLAHPETQLNLVNGNRLSALMMATGGAHEDIVKLLLKRLEIQVNLVMKCGRFSALMMASRGGHESIVKLLLARPETLVNLVDEFGGWSALMMAARGGHEGIVKLLLARPDIQVNLVDSDGSSALLMAARKGQEGIARLLLARPETLVNLVDRYCGVSALIAATEIGHEGIVKLLLAHPETLVNLVDKYCGFSALIAATENGREGIVELLLAHPETLVNQVDKHRGSSALMRAIKRGHEGIAKLLLARPEIQVNLEQKDGWSALTMAAKYGHQGIVTLLLAHPKIQANLVNKGLLAVRTLARLGTERDPLVLAQHTRFGCKAS